MGFHITRTTAQMQNSPSGFSLVQWFRHGPGILNLFLGEHGANTLGSGRLFIPRNMGNSRSLISSMATLYPFSVVQDIL